MAKTVVMDALGDQLLTDSRLATNQHGRIGRGDHIDLFEQAMNLETVAQKVLRIRRRLDRYPCEVRYFRHMRRGPGMRYRAIGGRSLVAETLSKCSHLLLLS